MAVFDNPFPGMNPFMEKRWSDVHVRLMAYIADGLVEEVPLDLSVRAEERVMLETPVGERDRVYRADVSVSEISEAWKRGLPPVWQPKDSNAGADLLAVAEPEIITSREETERWIEIRDLDGKLVTAIEVLSPANKGEPGHSLYQKKQAHFLASDANFVEIDLLRGGRHTVAVEVERLNPREQPWDYIICATRAWMGWQKEVYRCGLRERLPTVRIPLRPGDMDVPLAIQPMIDRCFRTGRYWQVSHDPSDLRPKLSEADAEWARALLKEAGAL